MLYALETGLKSIIGAADEMLEFEGFVRDMTGESVDFQALGIEHAAPVDFVDLLTDPIYQGLKLCPIIISHTDPAAMATFNDRFSVTTIKRNALVRRQIDMLEAVKAASPELHPEDRRTIAEIHGLDVNDPWDKRSPEQVLADEMYKKAWDDAKKDNRLSGESFGPAGPGRKKDEATDDTGELTVTGISGHRDDEGKLHVDHVAAVKLKDKDNVKTEAPAVTEPAPAAPARKGVWRVKEEMLGARPTETDDSEDLEIDTGGNIAIYHKVEVLGAKLKDVQSILAASNIDISKIATRMRNSPQGCWFAFPRLITAEAAEKILKEANFNVEVYGVSDAGVRLAPKGVKVVDEAKKADDLILPRPWNALASELELMTPEEKEQNRKTYLASEFCFCGGEEGVARIVRIHITPLSYFKEHRKLWDQMLDIGDILPPDLEEIEPGVYQSNGRDWNFLNFDLHRRGFRESMILQMHLNSI